MTDGKEEVSNMNKVVDEAGITGREVMEYVKNLTPSKLQADVRELTHDIQQLSNMMGECMKQSMATVVVARITVHVEMKMNDDVLFSSELGHITRSCEEE